MSACIRCGHVQKHDCDAELGRFEAIRAEAKAEGAAEERADILWWLRSAPPSCATLADAIAIVDARGPAPSPVRVPAPRCKTCGAALDVLGDCMSARLHDAPKDEAREALQDLVTFCQEHRDFTDPGDPDPYAALKRAEAALREPKP